MLASESWAEAKFVTERVGIPTALNTEKETLVCWRKIVNDSYYLRKPASFMSTNSNGGTHSVITAAYCRCILQLKRMEMFSSTRGTVSEEYYSIVERN